MPLPDTQAPALSVSLISGDRWTLSERTPETFSVIVFYRGKHCPLCRNYLVSVQDHIEAFAELGAEIVAVSMDSQERASAAAGEWGLDRLALGYGLDEATARAWGLYLSEARPGSDEPARFSEPGLMVVRADGRILFSATQSAPFTRPPMAELAGGLRFVLDNAYPARGTL
ncbi:MAG: peroxiredoxin-like family protein [Pseudomonadota bacterium]